MEPAVGRGAGAAATSAQEELDDLVVYEQQGEREPGAEQPLIKRQGGQAQAALGEAQLGRQEGQQQVPGRRASTGGGR